MRIAMIGWALALLTFGVAHAEEAAPSAEQIAQWAKDLGHEEFDKRNAAEKNLSLAGEPARAALEEAAQSADPEVKTRAGRLLGTLKTEPLLRKMEAALKEHKSVEMDMKMTMSMMGVATVLNGHFKGSGDGKKFVMDSTIDVMGQAIKSHAVADGSSMWNEMKVGEQTIVQKFSMETLEKMGGGNQQNPLDAVKQLRERFLFTDLKDGKLGDKDVHILEGTLREGVAEEAARNAGDLAGAEAAAAARAEVQQMKKSRIYVDKDTLMVMKNETFGADDAVIVGIELSNLKFDVELDEQAFAYTPPEGAQVMDMDEQFKAAKEGGAAGGF